MFLPLTRGREGLLQSLRPRFFISTLQCSGINTGSHSCERKSVLTRACSELRSLRTDKLPWKQNNPLKCLFPSTRPRTVLGQPDLSTQQHHRSRGVGHGSFRAVIIPLTTHTCAREGKGIRSVNVSVRVTVAVMKPLDRKKPG